MTAEQLRRLESDLWEAADQLRANSKLTANEYTLPVLGLIFLRQASTRFDQVKAKIEPTLPVRQGKRMPLTRDQFLARGTLYLPPKSHFDFLVSLPEGTDVGAAIDKAMRSIEEEYDNLKGVLPKTYSLFEKELLQDLLRIFNKEVLRTATGDVFGKIYEYFLNEFAMTGAQEGGEFFTPMSLVQTIVNFIEPDHGTVLDPACGSAGMFVQSGFFIERLNKDPNKAVTFFGQEKATLNTNLAKMNMAVHGLEGQVVEGNTFYDDKHELVGKCDFVMANPPFNVDKVDKDRDSVKNDPRLPFGLPKNDNANYLWIQYFYGYLNETGRAGFVMASSASDAGHSEKLIREQLIKTGAVDIMVAIGNNFFYTRSLPCTLWFYDRAKEKDKKRRNKILMLDARKVFRKVNSTVNDFSPEQLQSLTAIVKAYRGDAKPLQQTVESFITVYLEELLELQQHSKEWVAKHKQVLTVVEKYRNKKVTKSFLDESSANMELAEAIRPLINTCKEFTAKQKELKKGYAAQLEVDKAFAATKETRKEFRKQVDGLFRQLQAAYNKVIKEYDLNKEKDWKDLKLKELINDLETLKDAIHESLQKVEYYHHAAEWLLKRFPDGVYADAEGLCKMVSMEDVAGKEYSLSPGRYVGVDTSADVDENWEQKLADIHLELDELNLAAIQLSNIIQTNFKELAK